MTDNQKDLITLDDGRRDFISGETVVSVLKDINLTIRRGEMVAIVGAVAQPVRFYFLALSSAGGTDSSRQCGNTGRAGQPPNECQKQTRILP